MRRRVRRTISLSAELSDELDAVARANGTAVSTVVQHALRLASAERRRRELSRVGDHWRREATARGGVLTESDFARLAEIVDRPGRDDAFGWED